MTGSILGLREGISLVTGGKGTLRERPAEPRAGQDPHVRPLVVFPAESGRVRIGARDPELDLDHRIRRLERHADRVRMSDVSLERDLHLDDEAAVAVTPFPHFDPPSGPFGERQDEAVLSRGGEDLNLLGKVVDRAANFGRPPPPRSSIEPRGPLRDLPSPAAARPDRG